MTNTVNVNFFRGVNSLLAKWGWGPEVWPGAERRSNSTSNPGGPFRETLHHHTAARSTATSYLVNPKDRPQLVVLANYHVKADRIIFIAAGGTSHAGYTDKAVYDRILNGTAPLDRDLAPGRDSATFSPNRRTVGIETDGAGGPNEWTPFMYWANVAIAAACHIVGGWSSDPAPRSGGHKEHTRRKRDDPYANMGQFRRDVRAFIQAPRRPDGTFVNNPLSTEKAAASVTPAKNATLTGQILAVDGSFGKSSWDEMDRQNITRYLAVAGPTFARLQRVLNLKAKRRGWSRRVVVDGVLGAKTFSLWAALVGIPNTFDTKGNGLVTSLTDELAMRTQAALNNRTW